MSTPPALVSRYWPVMQAFALAGDQGGEPVFVGDADPAAVEV
jgi:hypothetical protein